MIKTTLALLTASVSASPMPGYIVSTWWHDSYYNSDLVFKNMADSGVKYVQIVVTQYLQSISSTNIFSDTDRTPTDDSVAFAIQNIKKYGMTPILKPHVDSFDGQWRGYIGNQYYNDQQWNDWFSSYNWFITHYANVAKQNGADVIFNIGTELDATEQHESQWRQVVSNVKAILPTTKIMYGCNWYPNVTAVNWWDAVDLIGVSAYFPLSSSTNPSLDELKNSWYPIMETLKKTSEKYNKPVVFSEIGYASYDDAAKSPNNCCYGNNNNNLQKLLFEAFFETVWQQSWFGGVFWWAWDAGRTSPDVNTTDFDTFGKPAQDVYKNYYHQIGNEGIFLN